MRALASRASALLGFGFSHPLTRSFDAYERLLGEHRVLDLLAEPPGVEDIQFAIPVSGDVANPAAFD